MTEARGSRGLAGVSTPALLVDLDAFDSNIAEMAAMLAGAGISLRPHVKSHRCPALATRQLAMVGSHGVTCATVAEAELMVSAGIRDVLIANEIVADAQLARIARLAQVARVTIAVDAPDPLRELSRQCRSRGATVEVLVDVDVGLGRCGVGDLQEVVALARQVDDHPGLALTGVMGYEGRLRASNPERGSRIAFAQAQLSHAQALLEAAGLPARVVSGGGTSTLREALSARVLTEIQAGSYAFMDDDLDELGLPFHPALTVLTTVISRSTDRAVLDAGWKSVGCQYGPPTPIGLAAEVTRLGEEHTVIRLRGPEGDRPRLGDRARLQPTHIGMTFALHTAAWLIRDGALEECVTTGITTQSGA